MHECTAKILIGIEFEYPNPVLLLFDLFLFGIYTYTPQTHTYKCMHMRALYVAVAIAFSQNNFVELHYFEPYTIHSDGNGAELKPYTR